MDYKTEFIPMQIKFDFINAFGESCVSGEWIEYQCNMRPCEEFNGWLEVMCFPAPNDKLSPNLLFDLDIENHLNCGPVASRSRSNVYGLFWKVGVKRCKLYFSFENKTIYGNYTAYLENVLRSLETYQVEHGEICIDMCPSQPTEAMVESGNNTQDISPMPVIVNGGRFTESGRVLDASGICHEVQLRRPKQKIKRRVRRPIGITAALFMAKRAKLFCSASTLPRENAKSTNVFEAQKPSNNPKNSSFWNRMSIENGSHDSNVMTESNSQTINEEILDGMDQGFGRYLHLHPFDLNNVASAGKNFAKCFEENERDTEKKFNFPKSTQTKFSSTPVSRLWSHNMCESEILYDGDIFDINPLNAIANIEQNHNEIFMEKENHRSAIVKSALAPTFITFGKAAELDEKSYDNRSSSQCNRDGEHQIPQLSLKKLRFDTIDLVDEAISSPSLTTDLHRNSTENCSLVRQGELVNSGENFDFPLNNSQKSIMPCKINNGLKRSKSRIIPFDESFFASSSPTDIHRPIVIMPDPPTAFIESDIKEDYGCAENTISIHISSGNAAQSTNQTKFTTRKLLHAMMKSKTKQILRACATIRELTMSLVLLPRTMHNFL